MAYLLAGLATYSMRLEKWTIGSGRIGSGRIASRSDRVESGRIGHWSNVTATLVLATLASMIRYRSLLGIASLQESPWNRCPIFFRIASLRRDRPCVGLLEGSKPCHVLLFMIGNVCNIYVW